MDNTPVTTAFNRIIYDYHVNVTGIERYLNFLLSQEGMILNPPANTTTFLNGFINTTYIEEPLYCC
jgi:hypothetical protein